jgi:hypothetical protein
MVLDKYIALIAILVYNASMKKQVLGRLVRRISYKSSLMSAAILMLVLPVLSGTGVLADTVPTGSVPATVSADVLPTTQVDGVVWATATYGNTVYATGRFSYARPAGVALGGAGSVARANLLAFDITTGNLDTSFVHSLGGSSSLSPCYGTAATGPQGCAIEVSPDGTRLYIGGLFSTVDGQAHNNFAAIDLTTNTVLPGFSGTDKRVSAITATNTEVYIGGSFTQAGGVSHGKLAAYSANGTIDPSWKADITGGAVKGLAIAANHLVVGGSFNKINGSTYYSLGAVSLTTGKNVTPWASTSKSFPIRDQDPTGGSGTGITSLSTDGKQVYLTSFTYILGTKHPGTFEGRAAINPANGKLIWMNDCVGDSYDAFPIGKVLYSASHAHGCSAIGGFPNSTPRSFHHGLAETTYATGKNKDSYGGNYPSYIGKPSSTLLHWFPIFSVGTFTGISQAGWTVTGNTDYVVYGGEFLGVNGVKQQGLVRFGIASVAPNKVGPDGFSGAGYGVSAAPADNKGKSKVTVYTASDKDNVKLTYEVYRSGSTTPLASKTMDSRSWQSKSWSFTDTGITPGTSLTYTVVIKDPYGNTKTVTDATLINDTDSRVKYKGSSWKTVKNRSDSHPDFGRTIHRTTKNGSYATLKFTGTSLDILSEKSSSTGTISISIDGGTPTTVDTSATTPAYQAKVFSVSGLSSGSHTVKITKVSGKYLVIDAFKVR